jgi:hypothetical protein
VQGDAIPESSLAGRHESGVRARARVGLGFSQDEVEGGEQQRLSRQVRVREVDRSSDAQDEGRWRAE